MPYQRVRTPIGLRRERVSLQQKTATDDGAGGQTLAWREIAQPWAEVMPLDDRAREGMAARQIQSAHTYHVNIRYRPDVFATGEQMRLVWRGKTLEIHTADDDLARKGRLILLCGEVK